MAVSASTVRAADRHLRRLWFGLTTEAGPPLLAVSLAGLVLVLWTGGGNSVPHRHAAQRVLDVPAAGAWLLMLVAMMPPLLTDAVSHVWTRSLKRRRRRQVLLFTAGYGFVWMTAGWLLVSGVARLVITFLPGLLAAPAAVAVAALWQATPAKQACLNRCHALPPLSAFGLAADRDVVRFGMATGGSCVGSCWALMLVPSVINSAHAVVMLAAMAFMLAERQARCRPAAWRIPFRRR